LVNLSRVKRPTRHIIGHFGDKGSEGCGADDGWAELIVWALGKGEAITDEY